MANHGNTESSPGRVEETSNSVMEVNSMLPDLPINDQYSMLF